MPIPQKRSPISKVMRANEQELPQAREAEKDTQRLHPQRGDNGTSAPEELGAALEGATRFAGMFAILTDARCGGGICYQCREQGGLPKQRPPRGEGSTMPAAFAGRRADGDKIWLFAANSDKRLARTHPSVPAPTMT